MSKFSPSSLPSSLTLSRVMVWWILAVLEFLFSDCYCMSATIIKLRDMCINLKQRLVALITVMLTFHHTQNSRIRWKIIQKSNIVFGKVTKFEFNFNSTCCYRFWLAIWQIFFQLRFYLMPLLIADFWVNFYASAKQARHSNFRLLSTSNDTQNFFSDKFQFRRICHATNR